MLGFVVGAVCVVGLVKLLRRRAPRWWHGGLYGSGSRGGALRSGIGGRWMLRALFERLETTPGQERAITAAYEQLRSNRQAIRDELELTRKDVAQAIEGGFVHDATLEDTFARQDRVLAQLRVSFVEALKTVAEALDEKQRKQLSSLLQRRSWLFEHGARACGSRSYAIQA